MVSPLLEATKRKNVEMAEFLLDCGASAETLPSGDDTILHVAAASGPGQLIQLFLERNLVDVNQPNGKGYPPLLHATLGPAYQSTMNALKAFGADFDYILPDCRFPSPEVRGRSRYLQDTRLPSGTDRRLIPFLIQKGWWKQAARLIEIGESAESLNDLPALWKFCLENKEQHRSYWSGKNEKDWNALVGALRNLPAKPGRLPLPLRRSERINK